MTVATTATTNPNVDEFLTTAVHSIGVLNAEETPSQADLGVFRKFLWQEMQALQNRGIFLAARERVSASLSAVSTTAPYITCDADTVSVEDNATITDTATPALTLPIWMRQIEEYQARPDKTVTGRPVEYAPEKQSDGTWRIYLYPVPDGDYPTITYFRTRRFRDVSTGGVTLDALDAKFHAALSVAVQSRIARHYRNYQLADQLRTEFEGAVTLALNDETPRGPFTFTLRPFFQR